MRAFGRKMLLVGILHTQELWECADGNRKSGEVLDHDLTCLLCVLAVRLEASVGRDAREPSLSAVLTNK